MLGDFRTFAFHHLPLTFRGLVVESTNRCNARCAMCYQSSGPNGSDDWGTSRLNIDAVRRAMAEALTIPELHPRFHLAGGEAFIYTKDCLEIVSYAQRCGYKSITATSNCFWASNRTRADKISMELKNAGLTQMEVSWDHWHKPYIKPKCIDNAILSLRACGIYVNLRVLTSKTHGLLEALSSISLPALEEVSEISSGPVFPTGRASKEIDKDEFHYGQGLSGACHSVLHLTINARGDVYPCCAGADQTDSLAYGNIAHENIYSIYDRMNNDPLLRVLVFYGVGAFVPLLEEKHLIREENYTNICHLCWDIFSNPERVLKIKKHFEILEHRQEVHLMSCIKAGSMNAE